MPFIIMGLICKLGMAHYECLPMTARAHFVMGHATTELSCILESQQHFAEVAGMIGPDEFPKVMCIREKDEEAL